MSVSKTLCVLLVCAIAFCSATEFHKTIKATPSGVARSSSSFKNDPSCNALYGTWYFNARTASTHGVDVNFGGGVGKRQQYYWISGASVGTAEFDENCDITFTGFVMPYTGPFAKPLDESESSCELTFYANGERFRYEGDVLLNCQTFKYNKEIRCVGSVIPGEWVGGFGEIVEYVFVRGSF